MRKCGAGRGPFHKTTASTFREHRDSRSPHRIARPCTLHSPISHHREQQGQHQHTEQAHRASHPTRVPRSRGALRLTAARPPDSSGPSSRRITSTSSKEDFRHEQQAPRGADRRRTTFGGRHALQRARALSIANSSRRRRAQQSARRTPRSSASAASLPTRLYDPA